MTVLASRRLAVMALGVTAVAIAVAVAVWSPWSSPAAAPSAAAAPPVETTHSLQVDGRARSYLLVRPAATSKEHLPVFVVLHGRNATPELEKQRTGFPAAVGRGIFVYPAGYEESWNAGACCAGAHDAGIDDVTFIEDVVHDVLVSQRDAGGSVYLVGFSNGAKLAFTLMCKDARLFAGVAAVMAVPVSDCPQWPAVPFVEVAWTHDPLLTFTPAEPRKKINGYSEVSIEERVADQRRANGCTAAGDRQVQGVSTITRWTGCAAGKPVELVAYQGTTHVWPAGDATTPSAEQLIWNFFRSLREVQR